MINAMASQTSTRKVNSTSGSYDWGLMTIVVSLLAMGLVMVFSSSYGPSIRNFESPFYYFTRQGMWAFLGLCALFVAARIRYTVWERWSIGLMAVALLGLLLLIPFGVEKFGASRTFFGGSVQPSEPAKIIVIIYISSWLASKGARIKDVRVGLIPFSVLLGFITVLIVFQPDISTAVLVVATALIMFFIAGADLKQLIFIGIGTALTFWLIITNSTYAGDRVQKYWDAIANPLTSADWQVRTSSLAIQDGGILGVGIAAGKQNVPLAWSDSIFAIIGAETGLVGALLVIMLFALLAYRGLRTALRAPDNFGMLLATGITSMLVLQALLNMAVAVGAAPITGVTLPFVSYGGSSLVTALTAVGVLLSISRYSSEVASNTSELGKLAYARFDFGWGNRRSRVSRTSRSRSSTSRKSTSSRRSTPASRSTTSRSRSGSTRTGAARRTASRGRTSRS